MELGTIIESAIRQKREFRYRARVLEARRGACSSRGYCRVSSDPLGNESDPSNQENLRICYDCDLFFGKYDGIPYRVEPI